MEHISLNPFIINKIINDKRYHYILDNIYYCIDGQNIFKRVDRYRHRTMLIILFGILIFINFHEILFNIIFFSFKIDPDRPSGDPNLSENFFWYWDIASEYLCDIYILGILFLSFYTFCKFGIDTKIYY